MISADLTGKTVLVTGGASGIGFATARLFAQNGAMVAINDLPGNPRLEEAVLELQQAGLAVGSAPADVGDPEAAQAMVETAAKDMGRLDYLINNAAMSGTEMPIPPHDLDALTEDFWQKLVGLNLVGPFRCTKAAAPWLKEARGAVVSTASSAAFGSPGSSMVYAATKAALVSLTKNLARGLAPEVRVNAVAPGFIRTPWTRRFGQEWEDLTVEMTALHRAGEPEDIAEVMLFLCAGAAYMTGQTVLVDGGL
jgi:3-oxoacyl-[acyl-carrier protein] reductase